MYHHLRGAICDLCPTSVVIEASGVGFDLRIPLSTFERLKGRTEAVLYTHHHVREDERRLFGFSTKEERDLFRLLLSVTGVGPSIALAALCTLSPAEVAQAVASEDLKTLQEIKGVGRKLAERIALELRDRARDLLTALGGERDDAGTAGAGGGSQRGTYAAAGSLPRPAADAVLALVALGLDRRQAEGLVQKKRRSLEVEGRPQDTETLIKECLRGV
ncbi:MAG: Holliday junction branch migration protein RuvA [Planctomycetes bacterium]|nr:Holliday junction branch migration protein RuvA [Planctomycetota bacterium]